MNPLSSLLFVVAIAAAALWAGLSAYVLAVERRRAAMRAVLATAVATLQDDAHRLLPAAERQSRLTALLAHASRDLVLSVAAGRETPSDVFELLAAHLEAGDGAAAMVNDAAAHRSTREKWRRMAALRVLARRNHARIMPLLATAIEQPDGDVANLALALLGTSRDPQAIDLLIDALKQQRHPASRVAMQIEHSPQDVSDRLRAVLKDNDSVVRLWAASLLARYPDAPIEDELVERTTDADPRVRKAAIQTLGKIGGDLAAESALLLLNDQFPYVRAHAARALGELGRLDAAESIASLLGDGNWWVRLAARESLEALGSDVWPVLMRCLNHDDRFIRNGAAEVFQNLGVLDSLIVMEAASDDPAPMKIAMLQRIAAAGGVQFTDSLVERSGPVIGPRIRQLLATIGLEHVEAR